jgi:hypothetical protein
MMRLVSGLRVVVWQPEAQGGEGTGSRRIQGSGRCSKSGWWQVSEVRFSGSDKERIPHSYVGGAGRCMLRVVMGAKTGETVIPDIWRFGWFL